MKLKTLIKKLEKANEEFKKTHGVYPTIFQIDNDSWENAIEVTLTSKVEIDGCMKSTDAKAIKEIRIRY